MIWRELTQTDAPAVVAFETTVFAQESWSLGQILEELQSPYSTYFGMFTSDGTLGAYGGVRVLDDGEIMTMGVLEDHRGEGFGRHLLNLLLDVARDKDARAVYLEVRESNQEAIGLYSSVGFVQLQKIRNYYRFPKEDALLMGLELK